MSSNKLIQLTDDRASKFNSLSKTFLFIEPYGSTFSLIKRGVHNGYNIIILTANTELRIVPDSIIALAQLSIQVDTADESSVTDVIKQIHGRIKIDAIIPGFEYFVPVAARVSASLGLPGIAAADVMNLRNKALMRQSLGAAGIPIPKYQIVSSFKELKQAIADIGFPAVCKPVDAAGSVFVRKVNNPEQALQAAACILQGSNILWGYVLSSVLLYEQYVEGKEYSVEGVITNGIVKHCSLTEKFVADETEFIEVGHIVNPSIDMRLKKRIQEYIEEVISRLRPNNCPFHAEVRISENGHPLLMEIAARLPGDRIGDLITLSTGNNFFDEVYHAYLGVSYSPENISSQNNVAGIRFFYRSDTDRFNYVEGIVDAKALPVEDVCVYYQSNECIPAFPKPLRRLGHVIMKGDNYREIVKMLNLIDENVTFI